MSAHRHDRATIIDREVRYAERTVEFATEALLEVIATPMPSEWDRTVADLAALGVTADWYGLGTAGRRYSSLQSFRTHLGLVRRCQAEGRECPWAWLHPVTYFGHEFRGVAAVGEIVARVEAILATKPDQHIASQERYDVSGVAV